MIIPVAFCFNDNYVIASVVAIYSLIRNASKEHIFEIHILHGTLSEQSVECISELKLNFDNLDLKFHDLGSRFDDLFRGIRSKGHYSKEMFFKFCLSSILGDHDKVILTDADVVFLGDVSQDFLSFDVEDRYYMASSRSLVRKGSWVDINMDSYLEEFSEVEREAVRFSAGYCVFNLKKMRKDRVEEKFIRFAQDNSHRLLQPEQDVMNIVCYPNIKDLPVNSMVCSYAFDFYRKDEDYGLDVRYSAEEVRYALENVIQLHFAGESKPWSDQSCLCSAIWHRYALESPIAERYLNDVSKKVRLASSRTIFDFKIPFSRRNRLILKKIRE